MMERRPLMYGFAFACLLSSAGCTELLLGGKNYYLDETGGEGVGAAGAGAGGGDGGQGGGAAGGGSSMCEDGQTACGDRCVQIDSDPQHCGGCNHDCLGAACGMGMCAAEQVALYLEDPRALAIDDAHVYWTGGDGGVRRVLKAGGPIQTLITGQKDPGAIAVDRMFVFWVDQGNGKVIRLAKDGTGPDKKIFNGAQGDSLRSLALDGESLYFNRKLKKGDIRRAKKDGDDGPLILVDDQPDPMDLRLLGPGLVWSGFVDPADVQGSDVPGGYVRYALRSGGGAVTTFAQGEGQINAIVGVGDTAVWADATSQRIRARTMASRSPATLVDNQKVQGLAADDTRIYWSTPTGSVKSHALGSGETRVLAIDVEGVTALAVDETHVYFMRSGADGAILRVAK